MKYVRYTDGYRYQLEEDFEIETGIAPTEPGGNGFVHMTIDGRMIIRAGYAWDGASGPALNTINFVRGSLVHDALYQLMRLQVVDVSSGRRPADALLRQIVREDGMWLARAWWVYWAVRLFGGQALRAPMGGVLTAPREGETTA
jgi:Protein of unknown function (DUF1353)